MTVLYFSVASESDRATEKVRKTRKIRLVNGREGGGETALCLNCTGQASLMPFMPEI